MKHELDISTEERLEKLERELTRAQRNNRRMITVGMGIVLGALALWVVFGSPVSVTRAQEAADKTVIRAQEFLLVNEQGKTRAQLTVIKDRPALALYDERSELRAMLDVAEDGAGLVLADEQGKARAQLAFIKDGAGLALYDEQGEPRAVLGVFKDEPYLTLFDEQGKVIWRTP